MFRISQISNLLRSKTVRNGGLFSVFSFFNKGIVFFLLILLAKYIGPAEYGELSMFNILVTLLGFVVGLSTAGYLSISYFRESRGEFEKDFSAICLITVVVSSLFLGLFLMSSSWLSSVLKVPERLLFVGLAVAVAGVFTQLNLDYLRICEKVSWYGVLSCGCALLNFGITLWLVVGVGYGWHGRVYAWALSDVMFAVISIICFIRRGMFAWPGGWSRYKKIMAWGIPLIPHAATGWMKQGVDRYIVEGFHTMSDVGVYSFALNLTSIVITLGIAFNQTNSVSLFQTLSSDSLTKEQKVSSLRRKERMFSLLYLVATIVVAGGVFVVVPIVMPQYVASVPYFMVLSLYGLGQCIYFLYCNYLFYFDKTKTLMYITFGTSLLHIVLSWLLTRYSLYLTCVVNVCTQALITTLVYLKSKKELTLQYGIK